MIRGDTEDPLCLCSPNMSALVQSGLLYKDEHQTACGLFSFVGKTTTLLPQGRKRLLLILGRILITVISYKIITVLLACQESHWMYPRRLHVNCCSTLTEIQ